MNSTFTLDPHGAGDYKRVGNGQLSLRLRSVVKTKTGGIKKSPKEKPGIPLSGESWI